MAQAAEVASEKELRTIHNVAAEALAEVGGDTKLATQKCVEWLMNDRALLKNVVSYAIHEASRNAVNSKISNSRGSVVSAANRVESGKASVMALANGVMTSLLDFPLSGGLKLADATREQVLVAADHYLTTATDMSHKGRWLQLIAQSVPADQTVGSAVNSARALELWQEARNAG